MYRSDPAVSFNPGQWVVLLLLAASWFIQVYFTGLNVPILLVASVLLLAVLLAAYLLLPVVNPLTGHDYLPWLMLVMVAWLLCAPLFSVAPYRSWLYGWVWLALPVVFFIIVQVRSLQADHLKFIIPIAGALLSLLSIYQFHLEIETYGYRAPGTLLDPNSYAGLINLFLLPSVAWIMQQHSKKYHYLQWLALFLMAGGVCATGSRAGILIMLAGIVLLIVLAWRRGGRLQPGLVALAIALAWLVESLLFTDGELAQRVHLTSLHDPSVSARFLIWDACLQLIQKAPWWGTGMGTFALLYPQTRSLQETETIGGYVHSDPLQLLLEGGWPMLLLVVLLVLYTVPYLRKLWAASGSVDMPLFSMGLAILLAAAHASVNFNFYNVSILSVVALYLGLLFLHVHRDMPGDASVSKLRAAVRAPVGIFAGSCALLLILDYQSQALQQPLMSQGIQASFTEAQCKQAGQLVGWRPGMPALSMVEGVCALKKNNCDGVRQALGRFEDAVAHSPYQPELYAFVAQLELMAGQCLDHAEADARVQLLKALEKNPAYFPARYLLYTMDIRDGNLQQAQKWITDGKQFGMNFRDRAQYNAIIRKFGESK